MAGKGNSSGLAKTLALLLGIASMGLAGFAVWIMLAPGQGKGTRVVSSSVAPAATPAADAPKGPWAASAPGRVEPRNGQVRLSPVSMGRVTAIPAKLNDKVNKRTCRQWDSHRHSVKFTVEVGNNFAYSFCGAG